MVLGAFLLWFLILLLRRTWGGEGGKKGGLERDDV